jgi:hypothetical protein
LEEYYRQRSGKSADTPMNFFGRLRVFLANARINVFFVRNLTINNLGASARRSTRAQAKATHASQLPRWMEIRLLAPVRIDRPSTFNSSKSDWKATIAQINRLNKKEGR